jgi:predicted cobalt transporter CbtA
VDLPVELILRLNEAALAEVIFNGVLESQTTDHRAAGESADAHEAPGMECGHAAPQAPNADSSWAPQDGRADLRRLRFPSAAW